MKPVNWDARLNLIANFSVVIGIFFLIVEINQSSKIAEASAFQNRTSSIDQVAREFAQSPILPGLYIKLIEEGLYSLTPEERSRVENWETARIQRMQGQYYQYQMGFLAQEAIDQLFSAVIPTYIDRWENLGISETVDREFMIEIQRRR